MKALLPQWIATLEAAREECSKMARSQPPQIGTVRCTSWMSGRPTRKAMSDYST
jgi:hypothetical protein